MHRSMTLFSTNMKILMNQLRTKQIHWESTTDASTPYKTSIENREIILRVGDFPAEALYTVADKEGKYILEVDEWPSNWHRPPSSTLKPK